MPEVIESLILDFLEWLGPEPRPYAEVMDAWRHVVPAAHHLGRRHRPRLVARTHEAGRGSLIHRTPLGQEYLEKHRIPFSWSSVVTKE